MTDAMSRALMARAERVLPGGVNSPVRAFRAVGGSPVFVERAAGARLWGADGTEYLDYVGSWGPALLGHAHPEVVEAVRAVALRGLSFGAPTALEVEFAELITRLVPSIEMLRCVSSGTEATMSALRVARGFTGRELIAKFEGGYHGHADALLVKAGSGLATFGVPDSGGVPPATAAATATLPYNDRAALEAFFEARGAELAAVIVEPVAGNMGCVPPEPGFLSTLAELCRSSGALLVFDEVMTGFRVARGGAQARYGVKPDLTCLGKVVGGGLPLAVYGGRADVMATVAPLGPVYQAGTLSGNPLAVTAGLTTLRLIDDATHPRLEALGARLEEGLTAVLARHRVAGVVQRVGAMLTVFFGVARVRNWAEASASDTRRFAHFHAGLLARGVYWPPSQFEAAFLSTAHTDDDIDATLRAAEAALMDG